jgi:2-polyprenyl-6-methoxyphenol hydroxylase-like FAD-dependent oxidoreductase
LGLENALRDDLSKLGHQIEYGVRLIEVFTPEDPDEPLLCTLQNEATGELEYVTCKYLIGADGAHSFVRRSMAITAAGDTPNMVWGIIDAHLRTDFKDIEQSK